MGSKNALPLVGIGPAVLRMDNSPKGFSYDALAGSTRPSPGLHHAPPRAAPKTRETADAATVNAMIMKTTQRIRDMALVCPNERKNGHKKAHRTALFVLLVAALVFVYEL